ncbi:unnamed protein product [Orchesella dallaii]|uniref:PWWP domain-containing protein n=1 Tax=Orchesella dallaii TaxID=48710 RepID=A0ABP1PSU9_9HEXA
MAATASKNKPTISSSAPSELSYAEGDIVWAKCKDWNWWPAMVRGPFPNKNFFRYNPALTIFVQYIDSPPTKEWIPLSRVRPFQREGDVENGIKTVDKTKRWRVAVHYADHMVKVNNKAERVNRFWIQEQDIEYPRWDVITAGYNLNENRVSGNASGVSESSLERVSRKRTVETKKRGPLSKKRAPQASIPASTSVESD